MNLTKKDQEAINHVASVSKNPHAEKITEWLITGCDVKYWSDTYKKWIEIKDPSWHPDTKYLLFKPKPAKPAYRVYRYKDNGQTYTQDRFLNGTKSELSFPNDIEFISDWIEYDLPKKWHPPLAPRKWPTPLVERIAAIDIKAAEWIVDNWDDLLDNKYTSGDCDATNDSLLTMFHWLRSPQGHEYWKELSTRLGE